MSWREVEFTSAVLTRARELFPTERSADGRPSFADFDHHLLGVVREWFSQHFDALSPDDPTSPVRVLHVGGVGMFPEAYVFFGILIDDGHTVAVIGMDLDPDFGLEDDGMADW